VRFGSEARGDPGLELLFVPSDRHASFPPMCSLGSTRARTTVVFMLLFLAVACAETGGPGGGLDATWTGSDTGRFRAAGRALWCPARGLLEITAIGVDSGVGIVLRPIASLAPGEYPVVDAVAHEIGRPGAAVAIRWFAKEAVHAFRGDSGVVSLDRAVGTVSGRVEARMLGTLNATRLDLRARLREIPIDTNTTLCPLDSTARDTAHRIP
jgi:hypothetical protein